MLLKCTFINVRAGRKTYLWDDPRYCGATKTKYDMTFQRFIICLCILCTGCNDWLVPSPPGEIRLSFSRDAIITKASSELPDTNAFLLKITDAKGKVLYEGAYGDSPDAVMASPGSYSVSVRSREFSAPEFSAPQYGDDQVVVVSSGACTRVVLSCVQLNSGVKMKISPDFPAAYPDGVLFLKSAEGKLMYSCSEKRTAYFLPGAVSLIMSDAGADKVLFTRNLEPREMLSLKVSVPSAEVSGAGMSVSVDTSRVWIEENYIIGSGNSSGENDAYGVGEARQMAGEKGVWVYGYIVGGDMSSSKLSFTPPFSSKTNIAIASRSSTTDRDACLGVQLSKGPVRDALNLVDNPSLKGRSVYIKGDIVASYYGIPGIQNITDFRLP